MGRSRLRLEVLRSPKARRRVYETRKKGLEKKARKLSTLCGVDVCLITYPPPLNNEEVQPFVWSNDPAQVPNLIESHKLSRLGGECSRSRTSDLAWFYEDRTRKIKEEIEKVKTTIQEIKYRNWDGLYGSLPQEELRMFAGVLAGKVESAKETIKLLKERKVEISEPSFSMMNPRIDENLAYSIMGTRVEQHPLPTYFDAQSYLEHQRGMTMLMINYHNNLMNSAPLMGYNDMKNVANPFPGYDQGQLMISFDYFTQMYSGINPNMGFLFG